MNKYQLSYWVMYWSFCTCFGWFFGLLAYPEYRPLSLMCLPLSYVSYTARKDAISYES